MASAIKKVCAREMLKPLKHKVTDQEPPTKSTQPSLTKSGPGSLQIKTSMGQNSMLTSFAPFSLRRAAT